MMLQYQVSEVGIQLQEWQGTYALGTSRASKQKRKKNITRLLDETVISVGELQTRIRRDCVSAFSHVSHYGAVRMLQLWYVSSSRGSVPRKTELVKISSTQPFYEFQRIHFMAEAYIQAWSRTGFHTSLSFSLTHMNNSESVI